MSAPEAIPPEEAQPPQVKRWLLDAPQDEIDANFRFLEEDLGLKRMEREVLGKPTLLDRFQDMGAIALSNLCVGARLLFVKDE